MDINTFNALLPLGNWTPIIIILAIWVLFWKGCSLWFASKSNQKWWFVALLVFNTMGILEIVYIFGVSKKKWSDVKELFHKDAPVVNTQQ